MYFRVNKDLLEASFSVRFESYRGKAGDYLFPELVFVLLQTPSKKFG